MRRLLVIFALALVCGCGGNENESSGLDELSDGDRERMTQISTAAQDFGRRNADFLAAASQERLGPARRRLEDAFSAIEDVRDHVAALESDELREKLNRYFDAAEDYTDAANQFLAYYESPGPADPSAEAQLSRELQKAARAMQREDRDFVQTVVEAAPADQRDEIRDRVRELESELRDRAAP